MKQLSVNCIFVITLLTCTGCVSTSISDSLALIEQEDNAKNNAENKRAVNKSVLTSIHSLRISQKISVQSSPKTSAQSDSQSYTFAYEQHNKELSYDDKITIVSLVVGKNQTVTINFAPAKGKNKLDQLAFSMVRAKALRLYINNFNNKVTIKFAPKLSTDTINLVTGA